MIEVTFKQIKDSGLDNLIGKLFKTKGMNIKANYKVSKIAEKLSKEFDIFNVDQRALLKKYALLNEDGSVKEDNGEVVFNPELKKEYDSSFQELINRTLKIEVMPLTLMEISPAIGIEPGDMKALGIIVENLDSLGMI